MIGWWSRYRAGRRPVPRWRRWLATATLCGLIAAGIAYHRLTDEARLRIRAEAWLEKLTGGEARIDEVRFDLFTGLHLIGVHVALPASAEFDSRPGLNEGHTIFEASMVFLRLRPLNAMLGDLLVPEILAVDPELHLLRRASDGMANWELMLSRRPRREGAWDPPDRLPVIRLEHAHLWQQRLTPAGRTGQPPQIIFVEARSLPEQPHIYHIAVTKIIEADDERPMRSETGFVDVDLKTLARRGTLPYMGIRELLFTSRPEMGRWLELLDVKGQVRVDAFDDGFEANGYAKLSLSHAGLAVPLRPESESLPPDHRYVRLDDVGGTIELRGGHADLDIAGRFHEAEIALAGRMNLPQSGREMPRELSVDSLRIEARNLMLPRQDAAASPDEARFVQQFPRVAEFVRDFDGAGRVDLAVEFERPPGSDTVELKRATLWARGTSGRYIGFPYRVNDLYGVLHLTPDGGIDIEHLAGRSENAVIEVSGRAGGYGSKSVDLKIKGTSVPLDDRLMACLSIEDRRLIERFDSDVTLDIEARLQRADYRPGLDPVPPWHRVIRVTLRDGSIAYEGFPYPLAGVQGSMEIEGPRILIPELRGVCGPARVSVSGEVIRHGDQEADLELLIVGHDIPFNEDLASCLPPSHRDTYDDLSPSGRFDLVGRLQRSSCRESIDYDFDLAARDASFRPPGGSTTLDNVTARLRLTPACLEVRGLTAHLGASRVELNGHIGLMADEPDMSFRLRSDELWIDERVREALPPSMATGLASLSPGGTTAVDLTYRQTASDGIDYTCRLEPRDLDIRFDAFPLPLRHVTGAAVIRPGRVRLHELHAWHEGAAIRFSGDIIMAPECTTADLSIQSDNLGFTEPFWSALPWRLRRLWNNVEPQGRLHLDQMELRLEIAEDSPVFGRFAARVRPQYVHADPGIALTGVTGVVEAHGEAAEAFWLEGDVVLDSIAVDGQPLHDVTARFHRAPGESLITIDGVQGRFHGGQIQGRVELDYPPGRPTFGVSLSVQDVSLPDLLNADREPGEPPLEIRGRVDGNLAVTGPLGDPDRRRGAGSVSIRDAEMFKTPLLLALMQVIHLAGDESNAFEQGNLSFAVDGRELVLHEIDLRGRALSMVGAGRVELDTRRMHLVLLVGSPLRLPKIAVLSELVEDVARELMEVHVEGTLDEPTFRADFVRSLRRSLEMIFDLQGAARARPPLSP